MWSDREADPPLCPGSGAPAAPASRVPDGFPHGAALCEACWGFVPLDDGMLAPHDAFRGAADAAEADRRSAWFNAHGW